MSNHAPKSIKENKGIYEMKGWVLFASTGDCWWWEKSRLPESFSVLLFFSTFGVQLRGKGDGHLKVQFIFEILHAPQFWIFVPKFKIEVHAKILNYQLYLEVSSPFDTHQSTVLRTRRWKARFITIEACLIVPMAMIGKWEKVSENRVSFLCEAGVAFHLKR